MIRSHRRTSVPHAYLGPSRAQQPDKTAGASRLSTRCMKRGEPKSLGLDRRTEQLAAKA